MIVLAGPAAVSTRPQITDATLRGLLAGVRRAVPDAYLVGGAVRDLLMGRRPFDIDVVTEGDAQGAAEAVATALGAHVFALDLERGQYRVLLAAGAPVREVDVSQIQDRAADLARRDYAFNAMSAPIEDDGTLGDLIDPFGGLEDLQARRLRMVSADTLRDDPLRLLRGVRLCVELGVEPEAETAAAMRELAPLLPRVAGERRRDELVRILDTPRSADGIRLADELGLLEQLLPELMPARGVEQPSNHHYYDVFEHSIETLAALDEMVSGAPGREPRPWLGPLFRRGLASFPLSEYLAARTGGQTHLTLLKLAGLLHDVAKPETKTFEADGRMRFFGHSEAGADKATALCEGLRFGQRETRFVARLIEEHLRPTQLSQSGLPTKRALYRFFRDLGPAAPACLVLSLADASAAMGPRLTPERWQGHIAYIAYILEQAGSQPDGATAPRRRLLDGNAVMAELGIEPGPLVGRILGIVDEAEAVGEIATREEALALARETASTLSTSRDAEGDQEEQRP